MKTVTAKKAVKETPAQLQAEVKKLKKELADCPSMFSLPEQLKYNEPIQSMLVIACAAPFMPDWKTKDGGGRVFFSKYKSWKRLQGDLLSFDIFSESLIDKSFRGAVRQVNYITDKLAIQDVGNLGEKIYTGAAEKIGWHCLYINKDEHNEFIMLKHCIEKLIDEKTKEGGSLTDLELEDVLISLDIILHCQKIYLSMEDEG